MHAFMRNGLQVTKINYPLVGIKYFSIHKAIKQFRLYILNNHTKVIIPHVEVRSLFEERELGERRGNWIVSLIYRSITLN
jgi:hypothetical protein